MTEGTSTTNKEELRKITDRWVKASIRHDPTVGAILNTAMANAWTTIDTAYNRTPHTYSRRLLLLKLTPFLLDEDMHESKIQQKLDKELGHDLIPASLESQKIQREVLKVIGKTDAEKYRLEITSLLSIFGRLKTTNTYFLLI